MKDRHPYVKTLSATASAYSQATCSKALLHHHPPAVLNVHLCRTLSTTLSEANSRTFTLMNSLCLIHNPDFLTKSAYTYAHVLFCPRQTLSYQSFNNIISRPVSLPMGTLCVGVLDHLVWSMHKRTAPSRDASSLQTDTSSKGRESASRVQVSSF